MTVAIVPPGDRSAIGTAKRRVEVADKPSRAARNSSRIRALIDFTWGQEVVRSVPVRVQEAQLGSHGDDRRIRAIHEALLHFSTRRSAFPNYEPLPAKMIRRDVKYRVVRPANRGSTFGG
jgi:hypothetical protein